MKTIQELYSEVMANEELKAQVIKAAKAGKLEAFLRKHGCEATTEEVAAFLKAKATEDAPLSVDELEKAAGGKCTSGSGWEAFYSTITGGMACIAALVISAAGTGAGTMHMGQETESSGRICTAN